MNLLLRSGMNLSDLLCQIQQQTSQTILLKNGRTLLFYSPDLPRLFPEKETAHLGYSEYHFFDEQNNQYLLFDKERAEQLTSHLGGRVPIRVRIHEGDQIHTFINYNREIEVRKTALTPSSLN